jgi:hypothetical protein
MALAALIQGRLARQGQWRDEAARSVRCHISKLHDQIPALQREIERVRSTTVERVTPEITQLAAQIRDLDTARFLPRRLYNRWRRIPLLRRQQARLTGEPERATVTKCRELASAVELHRRLELHFEPDVNRLVDSWSQSLHRLQTAAASPEHAGVVAEFRMAQLLVHGLPESFSVFHNVSIELGRWLRLGGQRRRSAQVDHIVVGPTGVFVIEVKLWSADFAASGRFQDPYDQVRAAGTLCHIFLFENLDRRIRVREIIASAGRLPPKPQASFARVYSPEGVADYISRCKIELDIGTVAALTQCLRHTC